jgi:hypothetical protein
VDDGLLIEPTAQRWWQKYTCAGRDVLEQIRAHLGAVGHFTPLPWCIWPLSGTFARPFLLHGQP